MLNARTRIRAGGLTVTITVTVEERAPARPPLRVINTTGEAAHEPAAVVPLRPLRKAPAAAIVVPLRRVG